jgi:hypothetical protein
MSFFERGSSKLGSQFLIARARALVGAGTAIYEQVPVRAGPAVRLVRVDGQLRIAVPGRAFLIGAASNK